MKQQRYDSLFHCELLTDDKAVDYFKQCYEKYPDVGFGHGNYQPTYDLHWAARFGYVKALTYLLDKFGHEPVTATTCFVDAAQNGHLETMKLLFSCGAEPLVYDYLAFRQAISNGHVRVVEYMINHFKVNLDDYRFMALACGSGRIEMVQLLISKGCTTHISSSYPYRKAVFEGHLLLVKFLESINANTTPWRYEWDSVIVRSANMYVYLHQNIGLAKGVPDVAPGWLVSTRIVLIANIVYGTIRCGDGPGESEVGSYPLYDANALMLACSFVD